MAHFDLPAQPAHRGRHVAAVEQGAGVLVPGVLQGSAGRLAAGRHGARIPSPRSAQRRERVMARANRTAYLECALDVLAESGADGLTIAELCGRLGVTKGSFYHHFAGMGEFVTALLAFW